MLAGTFTAGSFNKCGSPCLQSTGFNSDIDRVECAREMRHRIGMAQETKKQDPITVFWLMMGFGGAFMAALVSVVFWHISQLNH